MPQHAKKNEPKKQKYSPSQTSAQTTKIPAVQPTQAMPKQAAVQQAAQQQAYQPSGYTPSEVSVAKKNGNPKKKAAIICGVIVGILVVVYLAGVVMFNFMFMPNSKLSSLDLSMKTAEAVKSELDSNFNSFSVVVSGSDLNFKVDAKTTNFKADTDTITKTAIQSENAWAWPVEVFKEKDYTSVVSENLNEGTLGTLVEENVNTANQNKTDSVNAHIAWDSASNAFVVAAETYGTKIDAKAVEKQITSAIIAMESKVSVGADQYIKPTLFKNDSRFTAALNEANALGKANFKIMMGDSEAATVNGEKLAQWIKVDDNFNVTLDEDAVSAWATEIADGCNTVGSERTYTLPATGKSITVSGGTYGWTADGSGLSDKIIAAIKSGSTENISVDVTQSANALVPKGQADWGGRWIDVDLTAQHAYMYDNGELVWETDVVTGNPNIGDATPTGVWMINAKQTNQKLRGPKKSDGTYEWESSVDYWMPFIGNSHGLHDASWQSSFGGSAYQNLNWSHGCINLPTSKASDLFSLCKVGDAVVIHY